MTCRVPAALRASHTMTSVTLDCACLFLCRSFGQDIRMRATCQLRMVVPCTRTWLVQYAEEHCAARRPDAARAAAQMGDTCELSVQAAAALCGEGEELSYWQLMVRASYIIEPWYSRLWSTSCQPFAPACLGNTCGGAHPLAPQITTAHPVYVACAGHVLHRGACARLQIASEVICWDAGARGICGARPVRLLPCARPQLQAHRLHHQPGGHGGAR
jgi:hypothetical protein